MEMADKPINQKTQYGLLAYAEANGLNLDDLIDPNEPEETPVIPEVPGATGYINVYT